MGWFVGDGDDVHLIDGHGVAERENGMALRERGGVSLLGFTAGELGDGVWRLLVEDVTVDGEE